MNNFAGPSLLPCLLTQTITKRGRQMLKPVPTGPDASTLTSDLENTPFALKPWTCSWGWSRKNGIHMGGLEVLLGLTIILFFICLRYSDRKKESSVS